MVLRVIAKLYKLERYWDESNIGTTRSELRAVHFKRPLYWMRRIVTGLSQQALPQSQLEKACTYLLNHRDVLVA